jgi:DNA polymerase-1
MPVVGHDVLVGAFLVNSLRREQTLTELANADIGYDGTSFEGLDHNEYTQRAGEITAVIRALHTEQLSALKDIPKVQTLAKEIEWPVIPVLARMEHEGIKLDTAYLNRMSKELEDDISDVQQEIYGYADREFNVSSPKQLAEVLFEDMELPTAGIKKGKTGYSTAASELGKLRGQHPIIDLISRYREYTKLKSTYVDTLPKLVDERSRLHTTFNLTIAQTGRLSSTDPNLQNIPVRTPLGKRIRTAFVADPGNVLVSADYSQFELRLAACMADDTELIQMFDDGADIHTMTAAQIYERHPEEVTKTMRRDAKVINFGILYGMSPHGLVAATGMTYSAAKTFIDKYFELRKPILDYTNGLKEKARNDGYVETLFGRRRPTPDVKSSNFIVRQAAERAAINMPIQGTEADLMKLAMTAVDDILPSGALQLLQIHDSILVECKQADAKRVADAMQKTMEAVHSLPVRLQVDVTTGDNWGEL